MVGSLGEGRPTEGWKCGAEVAQWLVHRTCHLVVAGSNPGGQLLLEVGGGRQVTPPKGGGGDLDGQGRMDGY